MFFTVMKLSIIFEKVQYIFGMELCQLLEERLASEKDQKGNCGMGGVRGSILMGISAGDKGGK